MFVFYENKILPQCNAQVNRCPKKKKKVMDLYVFGHESVNGWVPFILDGEDWVLGSIRRRGAFLIEIN